MNVGLQHTTTILFTRIYPQASANQVHHRPIDLFDGTARSNRLMSRRHKLSAIDQERF